MREEWAWGWHGLGLAGVGRDKWQGLEILVQRE